LVWKILKIRRHYVGYVILAVDLFVFTGEFVLNATIRKIQPEKSKAHLLNIYPKSGLLQK
jgi:hypothetical protein